MFSSQEICLSECGPGPPIGSNAILSMRYSIFSLAYQALRGHRGWTPAWRDANRPATSSSSAAAGTALRRPIIWQRISAFTVGNVAVTSVSHLGAIIWRLDDAPDGRPVFEIAVARSLIESFHHWLDHSAAEFGLATV